jgi:hypothetical protein
MLIRSYEARNLDNSSNPLMLIGVQLFVVVVVRDNLILYRLNYYCYIDQVCTGSSITLGPLRSAPEPLHLESQLVSHINAKVYMF